MVKETGQILSTVRKQLGDTLPGLLSPTHVGHPCVVWAKESEENYLWLVVYFKAICEEYTYRYFKIHKYHDLMIRCSDIKSLTFPSTALTPFALAMPDQYKVEDAVQSYRNYYIGEKLVNKKWTNRTIDELPIWLTSHLTPEQFKTNLPNR